MFQRVAWGLLAVFILFVMFAPIFAYCLGDDDGDDQTAALTPSSSSQQSQKAAVGPFVAYVKAGPPGPQQVQSVVVYDLGAGRMHWTRESNVPYIAVKLAGKRIAMTDGKSVSLVSQDGSQPERLFNVDEPSSSVTDLSGSPDGRTLAVSTRTQPPCPAATSGPTFCSIGVSVLFIDIATKGVVRRVTYGGSDWANYAGIPNWLSWQTDGRGVIVLGDTGSERPSGLATIALNGDVDVIEGQGHREVSPGAHLIAEGFGEGCITPVADVLIIRNLDSGQTVAEVRNPSLAYLYGFWSPDGSEYLVTTRNKPTPGECNPPVPPLASPPAIMTPPRFQHVLVNLKTGTSASADRESTLRPWHGGLLAEMQGCAPMWNGPIVARHLYGAGANCFDTNMKPAEGTLSVGGKQIDRGHQFTILGFFD